MRERQFWGEVTLILVALTGLAWLFGWDNPTALAGMSIATATLSLQGR